MFSNGSIVCRLCLLSDSNTVCFEEITESGIKETALALKIHCALKLKVLRDSNLPNHVCHECLQKLDLIVWCNTWSNKIQSYFTEVRSLLESYHYQCDETVKGTLLSIFKERNANKVLLGHAMGFSKIIELLSQVEILFSKSEIAQAGSNFSSDIGTLSEKCVQDWDNTEVFYSNNDIGYTSEAASKIDMVKEKQECYQVTSSLPNSDSDTSEDLSCAANSNLDKTDTNFEKPRSLLVKAKTWKAHCNQQFVCPECNKAFLKKSHLFKHLMCHEGAKEKYQCPQCRRKFLSTSELNRHSRAHKGLKPYHCGKCDRFFSQKNLLDNHMNWHEGRKSHLCDICGEYLSSGPNLKTHILNRHSPDKRKPFKCKICGKCFSRSHHLENHVTIHEKSRPHQCAICGVTFKRSSQLREHEFVHSGVKQFTCNECNKAFSTKRVLNVHKLVHSELKPHQCTLCTKSFVRRAGLVAHCKTHSN